MKRYITLAVIGLLLTAAGTFANAAVSTNWAPTPVSFPTELAVSADGAVWFTEARASANNIVRKAPDGTMVRHAIPTEGSLPGSLAFDETGDVWFTERANPGKIGKYSPGSDTFTEYASPSVNGEPFDIAINDDGDAWFTLRAADKIGARFADGTYGQVSLAAGSEPQGIAVDKNGNVWVAATGTDRIYEWTTARTLRYWQLSSGRAPVDIAVDDTGNAWFTERDGGRIGRILPTDARVEYTLASQGTEPFGIAVRRTGTSSHVTEPVWFTQAGAVSSITACGVRGDHALNSTYDPVAVAVDSTGVAWFVDIRGNRIGKVYSGTDGLVMNVSSTLGIYPGSITVSGTLKDGATPIAGRTVKILYRQPSSTGWKTLASLTTNASGAYSKSFAPAKNTQYTANFKGDSTYDPAYSAQKCVEVVPKLSATYSTNTLALGDTLKVTGKLKPAHSGSQVRLEKKSGSTWTKLATATLNSDSLYSLKWKPSATGTYTVRMTFRGDADHRWRSTGSKSINVN